MNVFEIKWSEDRWLEIEWFRHCNIRDVVKGKGKLSFGFAGDDHDYTITGFGKIQSGLREGEWIVEKVREDASDCYIAWGDYKNGDRHDEWSIVSARNVGGKIEIGYSMGEYMEGNRHGYWWDITDKNKPIPYKFFHSKPLGKVTNTSIKAPSPEKPPWPKNISNGKCWEKLKEVESDYRSRSRWSEILFPSSAPG